jgi:electron transport complex protein RnfC
MLQTFKGGIHPQENKLSAVQKAITLPLPAEVTISLAQHIGKPAKAIVAVGEKVKVGTCIAEADGFVSAAIHSSVSGVVKKIEPRLDLSGFMKPMVVIQVEGDEWEETIDRSTDLKANTTASAEEILDRISKSGIVGMGGATFPTHVKLQPPTQAVTVIINAVECEPYLTADEALMIEKAQEICIGIKLIKKALHIEHAIVAIENNKPQAYKIMYDAARVHQGIELVKLPTKYPQGSEKQLIKAVTGKSVPSCELPIAVGVVVVNVATTFAIYEAVQKHKPLFERIITVTGKSIVQPQNIWTRVGTSIDNLLAAVGGLPTDTGKLIAGGPMMGKALPHSNIPVGKGTSGIVAVSIDEARRNTTENCLHCAKCIEVCPMGLHVELLQKLVKTQDWEALEQNHVMDCIECGSCMYICPSSQASLDYIKLGKSKIRSLKK